MAPPPSYPTKEQLEAAKQAAELTKKQLENLKTEREIQIEINRLKKQAKEIDSGSETSAAAIEKLRKLELEVKLLEDIKDASVEVREETKRATTS